MNQICMRTIGYIVTGLFCFAANTSLLWADGTAIDFNRDIRPILSETCFTCHGPSESNREAELRLDITDNVMTELESGGVLIVSGNSAESELYKRLVSDDPEMRMPPVDSEKKPTPKQIELIRKWIDDGGQLRGHWAFSKPRRSKLPEVKNRQAAPTAIDQFIVSRLEKEGLQSSPRTDKTTLIRRVTLDLTGLPPTLAEIDAFLADDSPAAYEKVVDRLLESHRYGEQMARYWLDAARYGDTHGLHLDNERSLWPYREWVINAFNNNKPFDEFTVEQLAGDLLPNPTLDQRIATGFNRCNVTTSEGGVIDEEFRVRYAVDRVETTATVWMGLTLGCAVCHEHKYDPVSQQEFYQLFAYFNSLTEKPRDGNALLPPPTVQVATPEQAALQKEFQAKIATIEQSIKKQVAQLEYSDPMSETDFQSRAREEFVWFDDTHPSGAKLQTAGEGPSEWQIVSKPDHPVFSGEKAATRAGKGLTQIFFDSAEPALRVGEGDTLFAYAYLDPADPPQEIMLQFNDGSWEHRAIWGENLIDWGIIDSPSRLPLGSLPETGKWVRLEVAAANVGLKPGAKLNGWAFTQFGGTVYWDRAGIVTRTPQHGAQFKSQLAWEQIQRDTKKSSLPKNIQDALKLAAEKRSNEQKQLLRDYFVEHVYAESRTLFDPLHKELEGAKKQLDELNKQIPSTLVMEDMQEPRKAYLLVRGAYDKQGEEVFPGVPKSVPPALSSDAPRSRLALARWLVNPDHPLTARVTVNRFWQRYFGTGFVKTSEDFGSQGEWPSHPELLDWLAVEFIESGWNIKQMQKLIVMSAAYQQSSHVTPELYKIDKENRLLARGPRFRMDAEMVRDSALAISGLLVNRMGGKSVKPYQPTGLWKAVGYTSSNTANFKKDEGDALYRRSIYTFWKRTSPPPSMITFDAPSREKCTVRRARTNTPLQALTLMNDEQFVEAARRFAERIMTDGGTTIQERLAFAYRLATARPPSSDELEVLIDVYHSHLAEYQNNADAARKLIEIGDSKAKESLNPSELAAWTMIGNLILNLDETVTKG